MKLIVTLSLLALCFSSIATQIAVDASAFQQQWCGNSKVDVEITSGKDNSVKTMASIVVPSTLSEVKQYQDGELKVISKTEQGLVLTLDGKANAEHLGTIYNYDEDSNENIFIPYLYLSSVSSNTDGMNVQMARSFKKNVADVKFNIIPVKDAFGTPLCACQTQMLLERIQQNLTKRFAVLSFIGSKITQNVDSLAMVNKEIIKWTNAKPNKALLESLRKQAINKNIECNAFEAQIMKLNEEITNLDAQKAAKEGLVREADKRIGNNKYYANWYRSVQGQNTLVNKAMNAKTDDATNTASIWNNVNTGLTKTITSLNAFEAYKHLYPKVTQQIVDTTKVQAELRVAQKSTKIDTTRIAAAESSLNLLHTTYTSWALAMKQA